MCSQRPWAIWTMPREGPAVSQRVQAIRKLCLLVNLNSLGRCRCGAHQSSSKVRSNTLSQCQAVRGRKCDDCEHGASPTRLLQKQLLYRTGEQVVAPKSLKARTHAEIRLSIGPTLMITGYWLPTDWQLALVGLARFGYASNASSERDAVPICVQVPDRYHQCSGTSVGGDPPVVWHDCSNLAGPAVPNTCKMCDNFDIIGTPQFISN